MILNFIECLLKEDAAVGSFSSTANVSGPMVYPIGSPKKIKNISSVLISPKETKIKKRIFEYRSLSIGPDSSHYRKGGFATNDSPGVIQTKLKPVGDLGNQSSTLVPPKSFTKYKTRRHTPPFQVRNLDT